MFKKPKKATQKEEMTPEEYLKFLEKNEMEPSSDSVEAANDPNSDNMTEEEYEQYLIDNEMKPLGYVEGSE